MAMFLLGVEAFLKLPQINGVVTAFLTLRNLA